MLISFKPIEVCYQYATLSRLFIILVLCQIAYSAKSSVYDEARLPKTIVPFHYDLRLITHLENSSNHSYDGFVNISLHVQTTTDHVVLHVADVYIIVKTIKLYGGSSDYQLISVRFNKKWNYMIVTFNEPLRMGKLYMLSIQFRRSMSEDKKDGYFTGNYVNAKTLENTWFSISHFKRNVIRNTIPCFDEPAMRATFNVTMGHHKRFQSYSNMNVRIVMPNHEIKNYVWSVHEMTPMMATHLLVFSVNNFNCRYSQTAMANPVRFRTCSQSDDLPKTSFAAQMAPQVLEFLDNLLQVHLPLEKIDQLVVNEYPTEAMENLGLVVYRSKQILQREDGPMTRSKLQTLQLIAHEMSHIWFGNMLGMGWWSDIWLNEGLTGYFQTLAVDHLQPRKGRQLLLRYREESLMYESQVGGMTLVPPWPLVSAEAEMHLYQKATSLISMVASFLGNDTFHDGLQRHLWQNSFASSTPDLFWRSLQLAIERESASRKSLDVQSIMDTWILQSGYPLVTVTRNGNKVALKQSQALNRSRTDRWWIPLTYLVEGETFPKHFRPRAWLNPHNDSWELGEIVPRNQWILFNLHAIGYYRVNYDEHTWELLATTLYDDFRSIHVLNRAQIVSDVIFLWRENIINWSTAFNVLRYIIEEEEYEPLMAFVVGITNSFCGISPETSFAIAKWLGIAGRWYAEFISYTFDKFVVRKPNLNLNSLDYPKSNRQTKRAHLRTAS
ncbi:LOW QUALITY PROTEIN: aminopeptidase Q [Drosophila eugracilis]|uniref:LOW QUALITY PROTEIN: aminopeptidase Q n=1 Tax=Drosophila eugracilis TaxID=29029 RepID=UPI001BDAB934|nr:LOW QUALITY PROTEIN: aminopeptidase Q [Drosophila eugracilis]